MKEEKKSPVKWKGVQYDDKEKLEEYNTMFQLLFWDVKEEINNPNVIIPIGDNEENEPTVPIRDKESINIKHVEKDTTIT